MAVRKMVLVAAFAGMLASSGAQADSQVVRYAAPDGTAGGVIGVTYELEAGERSTHAGKAVKAKCNFRVDSTVTGSPNDVILSVSGTATATIDTSGASTLSVRPVATEIQCVVYNEAGTKVFDMTRAESGPAVPLASQVTIRNDGPYMICARADAKYENGTDISQAMTCNIP